MGEKGNLDTTALQKLIPCDKEADSELDSRGCGHCDGEHNIFSVKQLQISCYKIVS